MSDRHCRDSEKFRSITYGVESKVNLWVYILEDRG